MQRLPTFPFLIRYSDVLFVLFYNKNCSVVFAVLRHSRRFFRSHYCDMSVFLLSAFSVL